MSEEPQEIEVIYIGRRILNMKQEIAYAFVTKEQIQSCIDDYEANESFKFISGIANRIEEKASIFKMKSGPVSIGSIYKVKGVIEDGRVRQMITGALALCWKERGEFEELSTVWNILDKEAYTANKNKNREKNADNDPAFSKALETLRNRYKRTPGASRVYFKFWLLEQLEH